MAAVANCLYPRRFGVSVYKIENVPVEISEGVSAFELVMHDERSGVTSNPAGDVHFEFTRDDPAQRR